MNKITWTWIIIWLSLIVIVLIVILIFILNALLFKHKVRVYDLGNQSIELDFKARTKIIDGIKFWQLNNERDKELRLLPLPPENSINIAKKGKKSVTVLRTSTGEYEFLGLHFSLSDLSKLQSELNNTPPFIEKIKDQNIKAKVTKEWRQKITDKWKKDLNEAKKDGKIPVMIHEPLTTKQRTILINNIEKARSRKGFSLREQLPAIISMGALVILVICLMVFWGDIAKPVLEARNIGVEEMKIRQETLNIIKEIENNQQRIISEQDDIKQQISSK